MDKEAVVRKGMYALKAMNVGQGKAASSAHGSNQISEKANEGPT